MKRNDRHIVTPNKRAGGGFCDHFSNIFGGRGGWLGQHFFLQVSQNLSFHEKMGGGSIIRTLLGIGGGEVESILQDNFSAGLPSVAIPSRVGGCPGLKGEHFFVDLKDGHPFGLFWLAIV